jgi:hypothetical protein
MDNTRAEARGHQTWLRSTNANMVSQNKLMMNRIDTERLSLRMLDYIQYTSYLQGKCKVQTHKSHLQGNHHMHTLHLQGYIQTQFIHLLYDMTIHNVCCLHHIIYTSHDHMYIYNI